MREQALVPALSPLRCPFCSRLVTTQQRTHWHDILGSHCPKFGIKRLVAVPLPQPSGYKVADDYKVQVGRAVAGRLAGGQGGGRAILCSLSRLRAGVGEMHGQMTVAGWTL